MVPRENSESRFVPADRVRDVLLNQLNCMQATQSPVRYEIIASVSRLTVRIFVTGLLSVIRQSPTIRVHEFEGEIYLPEDRLEGAALHLNIDAGSLQVEDEVGDRDRREIERQIGEEVLQVEHFPRILYDCSSVTGSRSESGDYLLTLDGQLSLHGVTRPETMTVRMSTLGSMLRASGECTLRQTDYGIKPVSALAGALRVKDELKLSFEVSAKKQKKE